MPRVSSRRKAGALPSWLTRHVELFATDWRVSKLTPKPEGGVANAAHIGLATRDAGWKPLHAKEDPKIGPYVDLHSRFGERTDGLVYLAHRLKVTRTGEWELFLGHDGGARMFVDGACVLTEPSLLNPLRPTRSSARLQLTRGRHEVVVAFDLAAGMGWGIFFHAREADSAAPSEKQVVLSDLSVCAPQAALAHRRQAGHWKVLPYEAAGLSGKCIWAFKHTGAPELVLPLNATGWHAIYLGLGGEESAFSTTPHGVRVKLSGDAAFQRRERKHGNCEEVLFKCADLTGQSLHIAQQSAGYSRAACLHYAKLVPLSAAEVAAHQRDLAQRETKRLISTIDGYSFIYDRMPTTQAELLEEFEPFRGTDFGTIWWQFGGADLVNYRSRLGTFFGENLDDYSSEGEGYAVRAVRTLIERGVDITKVAVDACHDMGIAIHIAMRPAGWKGAASFAWEDFCASKFYNAHPEWRCRDRDGTPVCRMSFAVPEVRQHLKGIFREVLEAGPDGINVLYNRALPLVLWEDAFCDRFRAEYGEDARKVPETDPRLYDLRCEILTEWTRELRQLLDEFQRERGLPKRLALSAMCQATEADNRMYGLDVERWAREGLIDQVGVWKGGWFPSSGNPEDVAYYRRITAGTGVSVYPALQIWTPQPRPKEMMRQVLDWYDAGADGMVYWDGDFKPEDGLIWPMLGRMGHADEMRARLAEAGTPWPVTVEMRNIGEDPPSRWATMAGF